jgi:pimeloyl-ACP methyl ester carboxylesterase
MPMHPPTVAFLAALSGCAPKYAALPALQADEIEAPLSVLHVDVDGVDVAYIDSGESGPPSDVPIVLLHGLSSSMGYWSYQVPALARTRRVLALDLPGYGASGRPDAPYTPPWYADVVVNWLDAMGIDRAVIVGHSMGGQVAMTMALDHPDRVDRLILAAPAGIETFHPGAGAWMKNHWHEGRALEASEDQLRATFETLVFNRMDEHAEKLLEERVRMRDTADFRGTSVAVSRSIAGMVDHPVRERLPDLRVPTLIVYGTDDRMIPNPVFTGGRTRSIAEQGRDAIPDAELVLLLGAGHTVMHDDPRGFNEAVLAFLRKTAPSPSRR